MGELAADPIPGTVIGKGEGTGPPGIGAGQGGNICGAS